MAYNRFASWQIQPPTPTPTAPATTAPILPGTTTYGSGQSIPVITVNTAGQIVAVQEAAVAVAPTLSEVNAGPGTYGDATHVAQITVNGKGLVTAIGNMAITFPTTGITQLTGDVTAGPGTGSQAATLASVNSNTGTFGDGTHVAQVTLDAKGRATAASSAAISFPAHTTTYFGTGAPATLHNDGDLYFDRGTSPYTGYVQDTGAWKQFA